MFDPKIDKPVIKVPAHACDSHFHIFGDPQKYPYGSELRYQPGIHSADDYAIFRNLIGLERAVLVQPSCFGTDNSCQLDAAKQFGLKNSRVVVDLDDNVTDSELANLSAAGACGIRINVKPIQPLTAGLAESLIPRIKLWEKRCQEIDWSIDFLFPDWLTTEMIPVLSKLRCNFTIAHMGMNKGCNGCSSEGFQKLMNLVSNGEGFCWIKLTAAYRISLDPDYQDVVPMARALLEAAPNRIIWGSDFPHASFTQHNTVKLFNLLAQIAPEPYLLEKVLVDNPAELYHFDK